MAIIRAALIDDESSAGYFLRRRLREFAQRVQIVEPDFQSWEEFLKGLDTFEPWPHVVLTDLSLPGMSGIEGTQKLLAKMPNMRVCAYTGLEDYEMFLKCWGEGMRGWIYKDEEDPRDIVGEIEACFRYGVGRKFQCRSNMENYRNRDKLTGMEQEVFDLACRHLRSGEPPLTQKAIAIELEISHATVEKHVRGICSKWQCATLAEAVARFSSRKSIP